MAPVKPMGVGDPNESSRRGVTGFHQEYNQDPGPQSDLNPDVVTGQSVLPKPVSESSVKPARVARTAKASPKAKK